MRWSTGIALALLLCLSIGGTARAEEGQAAKNPIVFWELASNDQEKSVKFFQDVFGWNIEFSERLQFYIVSPDHAPSQMAGGIFTLSRAKLPFLTIYIQVDDIDAMAKKVEEFGGYIVEPPVEISPGNRICLFNEPSGVTFAMIQAKTAE
jgi:predicted enzyme related to lactoylglutathione lyase